MKLKRSACKATTRAGGSCPNAAGAGGYCFTHDPARARERADARKRGGQNRRGAHSAADAPGAVRTVPDVLALLDYAAAEAVILDNSTARVKSLSGLALAYLRALEVGAIEDRIKAVEAQLAALAAAREAR